MASSQGSRPGPTSPAMSSPRVAGTRRPRVLPAWNGLPPGGASPRPDLMPVWVRVWYRSPLADRFAHAWMWHRGGWEVLSPAGGDDSGEAGAEEPRPPLSPIPSLAAEAEEVTGQAVRDGPLARAQQEDPLWGNFRYTKNLDRHRWGSADPHGIFGSRTLR